MYSHYFHTVVESLELKLLNLNAVFCSLLFLQCYSLCSSCRLKHSPQDLGQKTFGHVTCDVCGMVYTFGQADDQVEHIKFHRKFVSGVRFMVSTFTLASFPGLRPSFLSLAVRKGAGKKLRSGAWERGYICTVLN